MEKLFGGSRLSKFLFFVSWFFIICLVLSFFWRIENYDPQSKTIVSSRWAWESTVAFAIGWCLTSYFSYRLARGRHNPVIWENMSLFELFKYAYASGEAKIGFHSLRNQNVLLKILASTGIKKDPTEDTRNFLKERITNDSQAFQICRDYIILQMIHESREMFWDGYGKKKDARYFHEAEIIVDLKSSSHYMFRNVLEGLIDTNN